MFFIDSVHSLLIVNTNFEKKIYHIHNFVPTLGRFLKSSSVIETFGKSSYIGNTSLERQTAARETLLDADNTVESLGKMQNT